MKIDIRYEEHPARTTGWHNDGNKHYPYVYVSDYRGVGSSPREECLHIGDLEIVMTEHQMDLLYSFFKNT